MNGEGEMPVPSTAPMSGAGPIGRLTPRWSVARPSAAAASSAGLPGCSRCVRVGPP